MKYHNNLAILEPSHTMPRINELEQSGRMVNHKTFDPLGATLPETPKSLAEGHEGAATTIESSCDDSSDDDDDLIFMSTSSSSALITSADVVGALGATYAAAVNGVRCFLSSAYEYAELVQSVLAVATTTIAAVVVKAIMLLTIHGLPPRFAQIAKGAEVSADAISVEIVVPACHRFLDWPSVV
ncbi:hypothetical protein BZA05DRAFT_451860 [Tricharina praecox]|uniref:uncharacterized protein n=1 Tax=Tricharina praecox TaxID=43433 RepID=UPI00221E39E9|nr:uncharacterized protein BZA05DRAFT_451860 [Tricharina praecox]KAI5853580.1 hypothetical protein BZA05DRAFT_451860 [Tricharina praecox]